MSWSVGPRLLPTSGEVSLTFLCHLLSVLFRCRNVLKIKLVLCPILLFPVARMSNWHCLSPLHAEAKSSPEKLLFDSWDKKMGVNLVGRGSVLTPRRPVPLTCPVTQEVQG